jgi:aminopeptidase N
VAEQLGTIKLDQAITALKQGLTDPEARVRRSVVNILAETKTCDGFAALQPIATQGDPSYYVEAAALSGLGKLAASLVDRLDTDPLLQLYRQVLTERSGWNETVRSGVMTGLSQLKTSEAALNLILEHTIAGTPQPLRLAAIRALGAISTGQSSANLERILGRLGELSRESFFLTQVSTVTALGQMETAKAITLLSELSEQTPDGRVRRMAEEAVQRVQKAIKSDQAISQLREEIDQLKQDNRELRSRLEELEAKAKSESVAQN